jgi:hypothetical protein
MGRGFRRSYKGSPSRDRRSGGSRDRDATLCDIHRAFRRSCMGLVQRRFRFS